MRNKLLFILFLILSITVFSQEEIKVFKNSLKKSASYLKGVMPIVNQKNGDISLFLVDAKKIYGYLLNSNFEITKQLTSEDKSRKYKVLIGSSVSDNDYRVFLTTKKQDEFASINFSFKDSTSSFSQFKLESSKEKFVQTVVLENRFYLITILKNSSVLGIYSFDNKGNYKKTALDFSNEKFFNKINSQISLYKLLTVPSGAYGLNKKVSIKKIDENNPNSIEVASENVKLYLRNNNLVFSFDQNIYYSQILSIDLTTFKTSLKQVKYPLSNLIKSIKKTNSFLFEDYILLITATRDKFAFSIHNYNSGELIKEYSSTLSDEIPFKNTPIIQEGGMYDNYRELKTTNQFLRKVTNGYVGVSVEKFHDNYQITFGGKQKVSSGGAMPIGFGIPVASFGAVSVFFNPTYFAYNSYSNSKSIYVKGLFDAEFNHIKGAEIKKNAFDKIKKYKGLKEHLPSARTVFKYKGYYILGDYYSPHKVYVLHKFKN